MVKPEVDEYGEVVNSRQTYEAIAQELLGRGQIIVGWTDGEGSHEDILFSLFPPQAGNLQGGLKGPNDMFVSIMRYGAFGFDWQGNTIHASYIAEKLDVPTGMTINRLAELINGIRSAWRTAIMNIITEKVKEKTDGPHEGER